MELSTGPAGVKIGGDGLIGGPGGTRGDGSGGDVGSGCAGFKASDLQHCLPNARAIPSRLVVSLVASLSSRTLSRRCAAAIFRIEKRWFLLRFRLSGPGGCGLQVHPPPCEFSGIRRLDYALPEVRNIDAAHEIEDCNQNDDIEVSICLCLENSELRWRSVGLQNGGRRRSYANASGKNVPTALSEAPQSSSPPRRWRSRLVALSLKSGRTRASLSSSSVSATVTFKMAWGSNSSGTTSSFASTLVPSLRV